MQMSQVMAYTQRVEFKTLLEIECKGLTGFSLMIHEELDDFKSMLSLFDSIDVLIVDEPADHSIFQAILGEINVRRPQIKKVFFLTDSQIGFDNILVFAKHEIEHLVNNLKSLILAPEPSTEGYISIPVESLIHFKVLPFSLFVKLAEGKFIKRIPAHEEIEEATFDSFKQRGITELHFEKRFNRDFSLMLINNMINQVEKDYDSIDEKLVATDAVYATTQQIVNKLGFKPKVIEVCESVINQISDDVAGGKDNFARFLEQLRSQTELSFQYRLMELTSFIATQMIDVMEETGKREKIRKIVFASMFCDYCLKIPTQIHIRKSDQVTKLSVAEQKIINDHALKASELVNQYQNAPYESSVIIKQHHGSLSGVGFPTEISSKLLPLSKLLMAAQEISYQILVENYRHPIDVLSDVKLKFIDTPLEDHFMLFEKTCQNNLADDE